MSLNKSMEFIRSEYLKNFMAKMKDLENYHDVTLIAGDDNTRYELVLQYTFFRYFSLRPKDEFLTSNNIR